MILKDIPISDRLRLTASFPILFTGLGNSGKTEAFVRLSMEEKKRTFILNFDSKPVGMDSTEFLKITNKAASKEETEKMLEKAQESGAKDMVQHLNSILKNSYFIDDDEVIEKICTDIMHAAMSPKVDRISIDTLTELVNFCYSWGAEHYSGYDVHKAYGEALMKILNTCKDAVAYNGKFVYIIAHNGSIDPKEARDFIKKIVAVKGNIMKNGVETMVSTVIEGYIDDSPDTHIDESFRIRASTRNNMDTTRHKIPEIEELDFIRHSVDDIEQVLSMTKSIKDGKVV